MSKIRNFHDRIFTYVQLKSARRYISFANIALYIVSSCGAKLPKLYNPKVKSKSFVVHCGVRIKAK